MIESAVRELEGMFRTIKDHIETKTNEKLAKDSPMLAWSVEAAGQGTGSDEMEGHHIRGSRERSHPML